MTKSMVFGLGLLLFSPLVLAEEAAQLTGAETTMSQPRLQRPGILKDIYADFLTTFHGPTLDKFGPYSVNSNGQIDPTALAGFDNEAYAAYTLNAERGVYIGPDLLFQDEPNIGGKGYIMGDFGIKWFDKGTIKTDNFLLVTSAYVQAPTSEASQAVHMNFALRTTPFAFYNIPDTRWRIGTWSDVRYLNGVTDGMMFKVWVGPYVSYFLSDKFAFNLLYETETHHNVGDSGLQFTNVLSDFQPGFVWQITRKMKLNPYVQLFTANHLATDQTALGFVFYAQVL